MEGPIVRSAAPFNPFFFHYSSVRSLFFSFLFSSFSQESCQFVHSSFFFFLVLHHWVRVSLFFLSFSFFPSSLTGFEFLGFLFFSFFSFFYFFFHWVWVSGFKFFFFFLSILHHWVRVSSFFLLFFFFFPSSFTGFGFLGLSFFFFSSSLGSGFFVLPSSSFSFFFFFFFLLLSLGSSFWV